jgi:hypothetical protein
MGRWKKSHYNRANTADEVFKANLLRCHQHHEQQLSMCFGKAKSFIHFKRNFPEICSQFSYQEITALLESFCPYFQINQRHNVVYLSERQRNEFFDRELEIHKGPVLVMDRSNDQTFWVAVCLFNGEPKRCLVLTSGTSNPAQVIRVFLSRFNLLNISRWRGEPNVGYGSNANVRVLMDSNPETLLDHLDEVLLLCASLSIRFMQHPFGLRSRAQCFIERFVNQVQRMKEKNPNSSDFYIQATISMSFVVPRRRKVYFPRPAVVQANVVLPNQEE